MPNTKNESTNENFLSQKNVTTKEYAGRLQQKTQLKKDCEKDWNNSTVFTRVAQSLARGYTDLYYVNMDTDEFIEYHTDDDYGVLTEARRGADFFEGCKRDVKLYVHPEDQPAFVQAMNRRFLTEALDRTKVFELVYRRIKGGEPFYVRMKVSRMEDDKRFIVLAVSDIDEQVKQRRAEERMLEERIVYARLHAITGNFLCVYVVEPDTGRYREFNATAGYETDFAQKKEGTDFFGTVRSAGDIFNHPEDQKHFLSVFTKENVMAEIERNGIFTLGYRVMIEGRPRYVQLKAAMVEEKEGPRLIVGLNDIDAQVRQEKEFERRIAKAHTEASIDALTGIKNRHAYAVVEERMNRQIREHSQPPFSITILDVNDLKTVNDLYGHQAGDQRIREACRIICDIFKHSPVFRIGGDEFAVISQSNDYKSIEELLGKVREHNAEAARTGGSVIACGMSKFDNDASVAAVFKRADHNMYENKKALKTAQKKTDKSVKKYIYTADKRAALEKLKQPFAVYQFIDKRVVTILLSDGFCDLFGYTDRDDAVYDMNHNMYKDTHPDDVARIANEAIRFATEGGKYDVLYRTRKNEGAGYVIVHAMGEHVYTEDGIRLAQIWYTNEGTYAEDSSTTGVEISKTLSNVLHEQSLLKNSLYDYLTGLPSMTYFFELAEAEKNAIRKNGGRPVLLYINFSGMKFFNTKHGFAEGNKMLQSFARLLVHAFSNENSCRIGADHFAAITEEAALEYKLDNIIREFGGLYGGKTPPVHIGVYPYHIEDVPVSTACDRARLTSNAIKESYTSGISYFSNRLREDAVLKQYIIENIDTAIREKWIKVYLQPIIRTVNEKVCDVEALSRWIDPEKGFLSPASFIPTLEEAGLIYKLDLYMLDCVLEAIKTQIAEGFYVIPHSINLSRSDFDACDMVEEIRKRVDAAGIGRDRITIEITESIIGKDFDFMKEQVERFRKLGFPVWMDDFGSGYSSLDVLQSIKFNLLKFDMSFMRKLDEGEDGKVILTELMRMATALGLDTVCEGVETEEQVRFLREIGCSKLQGYYYSKPVSLETILEKHKSNTLIKNENPEESEYYESIGRVNLFDLGVIASEDTNALQHTFNTVPIAILEVKDGKANYVRISRSYLDFVKRFFNVDILQRQTGYGSLSTRYGQNYLSVIRQCCDTGNRIFFDEKMSDGSVVHAFARRISINPVTGSTAIALAVLSITEPDESTTFADIARSLAADYYNIFVIDMDTNDYIEYSSRIGGEELSIERHGKDFFASARRDTMTRIYEEDREPFLKWFTKENVLRELDELGVFTTTYRLIDTGTPMYVNMKITRMQGGNRIILGISIIDAQMKQMEEEQRLRQERIALGRIAALSANYIVLYTIEPDTNHYIQYNPSREFEKFGLAKQGDDFFTDVRLDAPKAIHPEDMDRHLRVFTKENMLREIKENGVFIHKYRLLMGGKTVQASLRAAMVEEDDGEKIILGVSIAD